MKPTLLILGPSTNGLAPIAGLEELFEVRAQAGFANAAQWAQHAGADVVAVDLRADAANGLQAMGALRRARPELPLVALSDQKDPDLILEAMRAGAREFVLTGDAPGLARVFGELARPRTTRAGGTIISLLPAKGGLGATTVATNLGGAMAAADKRVLLLDLDFQMGDALVFLDLVSRYGISDVLANGHRLDKELLTNSLTRHASGLFVLAQPEGVGEAEEPTAADVTKLLGLLARHFDVVICDGLRGFDERSVAALDASRWVLLLLAQNVPAIRNAHRSLEVFRRLGYGTNKVALVVNRFQKGEEIGVPDIAEQLHLGISATISNDYRAVSAAVNKGVLLEEAAPRARVTEDIRRLAQSLSGAPREKAGFLKSLFGRREGAGHGTERAPQGA